MRILFAADVPPDLNAGASGTEYQTVKALQRLGHDVDCIWAGDLPRRVSHGNLHYFLELPRLYRSAIRARCQTRNYDVFHVNQPHCFLAAIEHCRTARHGVFVHRSHGLELRVQEVLSVWRRRWNEPEKRFPENIPSLVLKRLLDRHSHLAAKYCDGTIVNCTQCRDFLLLREGVPQERVALIPQAVPSSFIEYPACSPNANRQRRVLYVGQFAFCKAPRLVAEAFRALASRFADASFTWVCDEREHEAIGLLLGEAGLRCQLLPWMSQERLREVYDQHGLFLFPSLFEGFGKAFLEAMARGLCVVASGEGGMRDIIRPGESGFLVPVGDSAALTEAAGQLMQNFEMYCRISKAARKTSLVYTWDRTARETVQFYEHLLQLRRIASALSTSAVA
jgi:glycosyltransferase involved in cell wall biosynthesis